MGESRKRKSLWDIEDETKHLSGISEFNSSTGKDNHSSFDSRRRHEFSASGNASAPKSRDHSGWPNWESLEGNTVAPVVHSFYENRQDNAEAKETGRGKSYSKNLSPGFGEAEWRKHDHTPEYDWSSSGRYKSSRSRSRSRSKSRSRRRDRSRSRDKARDSGRGRGRSRSRSRSDGSARDQTRSRTPIRDYRQSGRWSDGRSRHEKLSRTCRDFATGRCKRGSQCRFFHPDNISRSDTNRVEDDREENWRNRPELGHISGHSNDRGPGPKPRNDVNDPYYEENEQFRNQSRDTVPCRDFMKGKCRWGETCRFSHHEASGESHRKSTRNASFGKEDIDQHANKNVKPPCKFFAEGKCHWDNCWFSHEGPKLNNLEGRPGEDTNSFSLNDKNKWWNSPSWDDTVKVSDTVKSSGWTETIVANKKIVGEIAIGRTDNGLDHSSENERRTWGISKLNENYLDREQQLSLLGGSGSYDVDMDITESMDKSDKQEHIVHDSQLRNEDGISNVYGQNTMQEDHGLSVKTSQQDFFSDSHIQQQHLRPVEDNVVNLFGSDAFDVVNGSGNAKHPVLFPGHIFSQNVESLVPQHSLLSNGTDREHVLTHLNGPQQHKISPSTLQSQMQDLQSAVKMSEMSELQAPQFISDAVTTEPAAQMTKSPVGTPGEQGASVVHSSAFMAQRFVNEQQPRVFAGLNTSSSMGRLPSFSGTAHFVPLVYTMNSNPVTSSLDLLDGIRNGKVDIENNHNLASATVSHSAEQKNQMHVELSLPLSTIDPVFGSSTVKHHDSPKATEQEIISNSEVNGGCQTVEESKVGQENKHSENLDGHGIVEQGSAMKDDKGMRLFKNALVEFVKEILKPTWKEGQMSREVHKTIVKKVVDKVTSTIQGDHIPKTQNKVEQYLTVSKPKITKLVQAYLERSVKTES